MAKGDLWTQEELDWLKNNYKSGTVQWLCEQLNRSRKAVEQKLYKQRLSITGRQLKEICINSKIQVEGIPEPITCRLPAFHPVMLGIYPSRAHGSSRMWKKRREIILKMHDNLCVYCGDEAYTVDHVIPIELGGTDDPKNLVAACSRCNYAFGAKIKHIEMRIAYKV
jgi:hypothetical protein